MIQQIINGILLGGFYAVIGVGMSMMFGIVKLTNLAHGDFIILAAYLSVAVCTYWGLPPLLTVIVTIPVMFLLGMLFQTALINRVMLRGSEPALLVTFGLSIILQNSLLLIFSADAQHLFSTIEYPTWKIGGINLPSLYVLIFFIGVLTIFLLAQFMRRTYTGRSIRAVSDDTKAAELMGVNVRLTYGIAMGLALASAAVAGVCMGLHYTFYSTSGSGYLLIAFGVVVIGGMGSIPGTLVAGLIFGLAQVLGGANYGSLIGYVVLLLMLVFRPQGLFSR
jgi:branched-chain amino acid transport system permease protein